MIHYNVQHIARSRCWSIIMCNILLGVVGDPLQWATDCSEFFMIHYNGQYILSSGSWSFITLGNIVRSGRCWFTGTTGNILSLVVIDVPLQWATDC